ncbi:MAG: AAA family ATPase [Betaproteobacteria bacterium]|nr:AAA family ATPase [Betaproteobacteria bacterium]
MSKRQDEKAARTWSIRLLGDPTLVDPDGIHHALEHRAAALFALVAIEPGIQRRRVASLLWPDSDDSRARQALRQQLLRIKKLAGEELVQGDAAMRLSTNLATDLRRGTSGGHFLGAHDYGDNEELGRWVRRQRDDRLHAATDKLARQLAEAEAAGDFDAGVRLAERLVAVADDAEEHYRSLMRMHYLRGDAARAQEAHERLRAMLEREFVAVPTPETDQLARSIRAARDDPGPRFPASAPPPSVLRPPRLVGRETEWSALESCWTEAGKAIVSGEGGMGKTRLVSDFVASRGNVVMVAARPGDALAPYSLLARLVRAMVARVPSPLPKGVRRELARLLPELGMAEPIRDEAGLTRLMRAVESVLDAALATGLAGIAIDDLHHADAASIEALQGPIAADRRLALILTCRAGESSAEARTHIESLVSSGTGRLVELPPLTEGQVEDLLESLDIPGFDGASLAARIARHTGGNPMFVLETVKAMLSRGADTTGEASLPVAGSVTAMIERRLGKLSAEAVKIARCAAVAGQDFSADLVARVLGARSLDLVDAWAELDSAHVLRDGSFAHDLIYEAALSSVPAAIARQLHGEIAAYLESAGTEPGRIAAHWAQARRPKEAGDAFARAATQARYGGRRIEEASLLAAAARCFEESRDPCARFEALLLRADSLMCNDLGDGAFAGVCLAESAAHNDDQRLRALLKKAEFLGNRSDAAAAVEMGRRGIEMANSAGRGDLAALFSLVVAGGLCDLRRVDEALQLLEPLQAWAEANLAPRARGEFCVQLGIAYDLANRLSEALRAFESARVIASEESCKDLLATSLSNLATTTSKRGELARAVEFGRQALQLWREAESLRGTPLQTQALLAHRLRDIGHYDEAIALFEESLAGFRSAGAKHWVFAAGHRLALAWSQLGQHARAQRLMADDPTGLPAKVQAIWLAHRAEIARVSGGDALVPIREALSLLGDGVDDGNNRLIGLMASAIVPPDEGESIATAVAAWAAARGRYGMAGAAHIRAAGCALAQGALDRAQPHVEAALHLFVDYQPDNFYRAESWWVAFRVFAAAGRPAEAGRMVAEGRDWIVGIARRHVHEEFRESFLHRNAINRALLIASPVHLASAGSSPPAIG